MVLWRPTRPFRCPFHYRGLECKSRKSRNTWSTRQIWPWSTEWSRAKANRVLPREHTGHSKHLLPYLADKDVTNSPYLAAKNTISLISMLTIWWCPCVVFSPVVGRGCLLWPEHSLGRTLLVFALLHSVLQGQICLLLQVFLDLLLLHSSPQ